MYNAFNPRPAATCWSSGVRELAASAEEAPSEAGHPASISQQFRVVHAPQARRVQIPGPEHITKKGSADEKLRNTPQAAQHQAHEPSNSTGSS